MLDSSGFLRSPGSIRTAGCAANGPLALLLLLMVVVTAKPAGAADPLPSIFGASRRVQGPATGQETQGVPQGPVGWSLEAPIDPDTYRLVPGDVLYLGLWGGTTKGYSLTITPEGALIVPDLGPVVMAGETLRSGEARLRERLTPLYKGTNVSLRILSPGRFRVAVIGMVERPGLYDVTRLDHLTTAIEMAGGIRSGGSVRRIRLEDSQDDREVDLAPWLLRGDAAANPLLEPGTSIEIPAAEATVRVRGPVNGRGGLEMPGDASIKLPDRPEEEPNRAIEWREGDTVGSLLDMVGGLSERAAGSGALYRTSGAPIPLDLREEQARATPVRAGDVLEVDYASRWVFVVGAVRSPGRYPYLPGLLASDYINMAGGPSELGRSNAWSIEPDPETHRSLEHDGPLAAGVTIRVPERRSYTLTTILAPLTSATAFIISLFALARRG